MSSNDLLNGNGQTFDPTAIGGIDDSMVMDGGPLFPILQWHSGDRKMRKVGGMDYQGGFFVKTDAIEDELMVAAGWEKAEWTHDGGKLENGWYRRQAALAIVAMRERWEVFAVGSSRPLVFPWNKYDEAKKQGSPRSRLQVLAIVRGLESAGPVVVTLRGMSALAFKGRNGDGASALAKFQQTVITAANQKSAAAGQRGKRWPLFAFWLPVGADRDQDGTPRFTTVGSGNSTSEIVVPIAIGLPAKADAVNLNTFYVGNDLLEVCKATWVDAESNWTHAWDNLAPEQEQAAAGGEVVAETATAQVSAVDLESMGV